MPQVGHKLTGYILAEDVYAPQNVPSTATTSVDGYALRCKSHHLLQMKIFLKYFAPFLAAETLGIHNVLTTQTHPLATILPTGSAYRINTGGPLPAGTDTVIMVEDTELVSTSQDDHGVQEEKEIKTLAHIPIGENVREPGSDVTKGDLVLRAGDRITQRGGEVGTLAFVGRREVCVFSLADRTL